MYKYKKYYELIKGFVYKQKWSLSKGLAISFASNL